MEQPTGTPSTPGTPAGVVAGAGDLIGSLTETLWAARDSTQLVQTVEQLEQLRAQVAALTSSVLAEVHARGTAKTELAWGSTAEWYTHLAGTRRAFGHQTIRQAAILVGDRSATHAAMTAGRVSPAQAAVIVDAVDKLPPTRASGSGVRCSSSTLPPHKPGAPPPTWIRSRPDASEPRQACSPCDTAERGPGGLGGRRWCAPPLTVRGHTARRATSA